MATITGNQLRQLVPALGAAADSWALTLSPVMDRNAIDTPVRQAAFLAQVIHESSGFSRLVENLDYSAERLLQVWPSRFPTLSAAQPYAHQPQLLANYVYGGRLGNGPPESNDGWLHRGRGLLQLTGRTNYQMAGTALSLPLEAQPEMVTTPAVAALTAGWFWIAHGRNGRTLNALADAGDDESMRRAVNGGTVGLAECRALRHRVQAVLAGETV